MDASGASPRTFAQGHARMDPPRQRWGGMVGLVSPMEGALTVERSTAWQRTRPARPRETRLQPPSSPRGALFPAAKPVGG